MKSSQPPVLATWMLEHLIPRSKGEILAGDLLEQFVSRVRVPGIGARFWER
jgi:hypothetical protein